MLMTQKFSSLTSHLDGSNTELCVFDRVEDVVLQHPATSELASGVSKTVLP